MPTGDSWAFQNPDGDVINLSRDPYTVLRYGGHGLLDPTIDRTPRPHGGSQITNLRYDDRIVSLEMRVRGTDAEGTQDNLERLMDAFYPQSSSANHREGELIHTRYDGEVRRLRCLLIGGLMLEEDTWRTPMRRHVELTFEASNPNWYEGFLQQAGGVLAVAAGAPSFPFSFPVGIGVTGAVEQIEVDYTGARGLQPTLSAQIEIDGPVLNPEISHAGTGRTIRLTQNVETNETLILRMGGDPAVVNDAMSVTITPGGRNVFGSLRGNLARIILWPGENVIRFSHDGSEPNSAVRIKWRREYGVG